MLAFSLKEIRKWLGIRPESEEDKVFFYEDGCSAVFGRFWISIGIVIEAPSVQMRKQLYATDGDDDLSDGSLEELAQYIFTPKAISLRWLIAEDNKRHALANARVPIRNGRALPFTEIKTPRR